MAKKKKFEGVDQLIEVGIDVESTGFPDIQKYDYVAVDTETEGLYWHMHNPFGLSISTPDGRDFYWDLRDNPKAVEFAKRELPRAKMLVGHNIKFDMHFLKKMGADVSGVPLRDTMVRAALINEHETSFSLDYLASKYLRANKLPVPEYMATIFGGVSTGNVQMPRLQFLGRTWPEKPALDEHRDFEQEAQIAANYAALDTHLTLRLFEYQQTKIAQQSLERVEALEMRLMPVLYRMERHGVRVDLDRTQRALETFQRKVAQYEAEIFKVAGFMPNVKSKDDMPKFFNVRQRQDGEWVTDRGELLFKTPGGNPSFSKASLEAMDDPRAQMVLDLRALRTIVEMLNSHILGAHNNGRVHASFNQTRGDYTSGLGTRSGRLSCSDPNLQQIHKRNKELAAIFRSLFFPDEGTKWHDRDWDQMDFRVFAHYVNDSTINGIYANDPSADFHAVIRDLINGMGDFNIPRSPGPDGGANAKQINLASVFGMGPGKLAKQMGMSFTEERFRGNSDRTYLKAGPEAQAIFNAYHGAVPGVKRISKEAESVAKARGWVRTVMGRRIHFPDPNFCYKAAGLIYQGTAADCMKQKLIEIDEYFNAISKGVLALVVHDEFIYFLPPGSDKEDMEVKRILEAFGPDDVINLRIPIRTDAGIGDDWWDAIKGN